MIQHDPVVKEGDTPLYEARRIANKLKEMAMSLRKHAKMHTFILSVLFITSMLNISIFEGIVSYCELTQPEDIRAFSACIDRNLTTVVSQKGFVNPFLIGELICFILPMVVSFVCIYYLCSKQGRCCCSLTEKISINYYKYSYYLLAEHTILVVSHFLFFFMVIVIYVHLIVVGKGFDHALHQEIYTTRAVYMLPPLIILLHFLYGVGRALTTLYHYQQRTLFDCIFCEGLVLRGTCCNTICTYRDGYEMMVQAGAGINPA